MPDHPPPPTPINPSPGLRGPIVGKSIETVIIDDLAPVTWHKGDGYLAAGYTLTALAVTGIIAWLTLTIVG